MPAGLGSTPPLTIHKLYYSNVAYHDVNSGHNNRGRSIIIVLAIKSHSASYACGRSVVARLGQRIESVRL